MPHAKRTFGGVLGGFLGLVGLSAIAGILVTATVTPAIAISGYAASSGISLFDSLPGNLEVDRPMEPTTIYAPTGEGDDYYELATFYDQNREPVEYDEVSHYVYDALLSTEDPRYYEHGGVDLIGTARALLNNALTETTQGGSSISQQYVKGVQVQTCERTADDSEALAECADEATTASGTEGYQRKLQEMRYAITIEQEYSKEQILIGYLNLVNFGGVTYGIEAAAQRYYSKPAKDLNLNEAATLAGIVNYPATLRMDQPDNEDNGAGNGYAQTKDRRDSVLWRMLQEGTITQEQYDSTAEQPVEPNLSNRVRGCAAPQGTAYFCQYVKNTILNDSRYDEAFGSEAGSPERADMLSRGGLEVYTTLDNNLQYSAQQTMQNNVPQDVDGIRLGATTVQLEADTGNILSMAQNTRFSETGDRAAGETSVVFAGDMDHGASEGFSAGSTYKIFTVLDWLKNGRSINETLDGRVGQTLPFSCNGTPNGTYTTTRGDNFAGNAGRVGTVREFTGMSLNTGFYAMASQLDVCEIHQLAADMGVTLGNGEPVTSGGQGAFSVVGSKALAPVAVASVYATVANGGVRCEPTAILRVVDAAGEEINMPEDECERVLDENIAHTAAFDMKSVMEGSNTGASARVNDGIETFGKTGTHEDLQSWMVQTSTNVATAAWVGNWTNVFLEEEDFNPNTALWYANKVDLATGAETPHMADLFAYNFANLRYTLSRENQAAANSIYGGDPFPKPDPNLTQVVVDEVPNVSGMSVSEATSVLEGEGFKVRVGDTVSGDQDEGLVERTDPSGEAPAGSLVTLLISDGDGGTKVPDVTGLSTTQAYKRLFDEGLRASIGDCTVSASAPANGRVVRTDPSAGTQVKDRTEVTIYSEARVCRGNNN